MADAPDSGQPPQPGFKRLNFFKGLVTYYTDWIDNEAYRVGKLRFHNQHCHSPGVVVGYQSEMMVSGRGDLSIEVQPGCAIDAAGNEILLWETQIKHIDPQKMALKLPQTVYVVVRYTEELADFISYKKNLEVRGHRRVLEGATVEITPLLPNVNKEVEIARVLLDTGVKSITDAKNPNAPQANEIDLRYVLRAGHAGSNVDRPTQLAIATMLHGMRMALGRMARSGRLKTAHDALATILAVSVIHAADLTNTRNLVDLFAVLFEMQVAVYVEIKTDQPLLMRVAQWDEWVAQLREMQKILQSRTPARDRLGPLCNTQHRINQIVVAMFAAAPTRAGL
jgi:hypothetical protein